MALTGSFSAISSGMLNRLLAVFLSWSLENPTVTVGWYSMDTQSLLHN